MANNYFQFKQFTIYQDQCAMKVGTDGVLLGAYAKLDNAKNILDIGTGTGLISLMLAQRSGAKITAIEIDKNASKQALDNIKNSDFANRIIVENISLQNFVKITATKFDLIVSNPPYFQNSYKAETESRTIARHTTKLTYAELISSSKKLLTQNGEICIIVPKGEEQNIHNIATENSLYINKILNIKPTLTKLPKRIIITISRTKKEISLNELVIESGGRHNYSDEYINLLKNFYIKF